MLELAVLCTSELEFVEGCIPSGATDFGQSEHDTPHFTLVAKTIFSNSLQFSVPDGRLVRDSTT